MVRWRGIAVNRLLLHHLLDDDGMLRAVLMEEKNVPVLLYCNLKETVNRAFWDLNAKQKSIRTWISVVLVMTDAFAKGLEGELDTLIHHMVVGQSWCAISSA